VVLHFGFAGRSQQRISTFYLLVDSVILSLMAHFFGQADEQRSSEQPPGPPTPEQCLQRLRQAGFAAVEVWTPRFFGPQPQQALLALVTQQPHRSMQQQQQLRWWMWG
jgi:hypothetical protein